MQKWPQNISLVFADDNLIFCQEDLEDVKSIQSLLKQYEKASGQQVNREKTFLFFSKGVADSTKNSIKNYLGVLEIKEYEKYLGLPVVVGKNRRASLNYIKERVGKTSRVEGKIAL